MNFTLQCFYATDTTYATGTKTFPIFHLKKEYEDEVVAEVLTEELREAFQGKTLAEQIPLSVLREEEIYHEKGDLTPPTKEEMITAWGEEINGIYFCNGILATEGGLYLGVIVDHDTPVFLGKRATYQSTLYTSEDNNGAGYKGGDPYTGTIRATLLYSPSVWDATTVYRNAAFRTMKEIFIPEGVTTIGRGAFYYCRSLKHIWLPSTLRRIEADAFFHCDELEELVIPEGVSEIGHSAFSCCVNLKKLTLPSSVSTLAARAFATCESLTEITLPAGITTVPNSLCLHCYSLKKVSLPHGITAIEQYAFYVCESLAEITIPEGVVEIADNAFDRCTGLKKVSLPSTLQKIGFAAFPRHPIEGLIYPKKK